jgi:hypothetical protein
VYREITAVCSQILTKPINTLCGKKELLHVKQAVQMMSTVLYTLHTSVGWPLVSRNAHSGNRWQAERQDVRAVLWQRDNLIASCALLWVLPGYEFILSGAESLVRGGVRPFIIRNDVQCLKTPIKNPNGNCPSLLLTPHTPRARLMRYGQQKKKKKMRASSLCRAEDWQELQTVQVIMPTGIIEGVRLCASAQEQDRREPSSNDAETVAFCDTAHRLQQGVLFSQRVIAVPLMPTRTVRPSMHRYIYI